MAAAVAAVGVDASAVWYRPAVKVEPVRISVREAGSVDFESVAPFRRLRPRRGQRNFVGDWWLATTKRHVTFESWCERDHLIAFDFDPGIVEIAGQPLQFEFSIDVGCPRLHIPDCFLRMADGSAAVVDIKPDELITARDRVNFAGTAALCEAAGWGYRRLGELPTVLSANLRWLAGYRRERVNDSSVAARAKQVVERCPGISLHGLASEVGEPTLVLPKIFHMLWQQQLIAELSGVKLSRSTAIYPGSPT
ncbi:MAG: TnsA-like heteromeric transposase endonuclease subunit [Mycobacterium sp.]|nr:TnsA-like heteromeric transposase endonuclease subunit [Mycobacterium sp.]